MNKWEDRQVVLRRQNLTTFDIFYGTMHVREDLGKEIVTRNNREEDNFHWWVEKEP